MITPLWFLTYILVVGKLAGVLDAAWWIVLTPAALSMLGSAIFFLLFQVKFIDEADDDE